ncbi:unnamed protein product [Brachionus calyciflorus]|uniref:Uncharacterized protein n=1 Tax=Brachionus calyciflorus TaxID=104777 RepID=A0A814EFG7_9BILA|nr:unnamed protein product [Brachionus calyciflorus]
MVNRSNSNSMASSRPTRSRSTRVRGNTRGRTNIRRASVNEQAINNSDGPSTSNSITNDALFLNFQSCQCDDASIVKSIMDYPFRYVPLHELKILLRKIIGSREVIINAVAISDRITKIAQNQLIYSRQFKQYKSSPTVQFKPILNPVQQSSSTQPTNSSSSSYNSSQITNLTPPSSSTQPTDSSPSSSSSNPVQSNISFQNAHPSRSPIASEYLHPPGQPSSSSQSLNQPRTSNFEINQSFEQNERVFSNNKENFN